MRYYQPPQQQVVRIGNPQQQAQNVAFHNNLMNQMYQYMMQTKTMGMEAMKGLGNIEYYDDKAYQENILPLYKGIIDAVSRNASPGEMMDILMKTNQQAIPFQRISQAQTRAGAEWDKIRRENPNAVLGRDPRTRSVKDEFNGQFISPETVKTYTFDNRDIRGIIGNEVGTTLNRISIDPNYLRTGNTHYSRIDVKKGLADADIEKKFNPESPEAQERVELLFENNNNFREVWLDHANGNVDAAKNLAAKYLHNEAKLLLNEKIESDIQAVSVGAGTRGRGSENSTSTPPFVPDMHTDEGIAQININAEKINPKIFNVRGSIGHDPEKIPYLAPEVQKRDKVSNEILKIEKQINTNKSTLESRIKSYKKIIELNKNKPEVIKEYERLIKEALVELESNWPELNEKIKIEKTKLGEINKTIDSEMVKADKYLTSSQIKQRNNLDNFRKNLNLSDDLSYAEVANIYTDFTQNLAKNITSLSPQFSESFGIENVTGESLITPTGTLRAYGNFQLVNDNGKVQDINGVGGDKGLLKTLGMKASEFLKALETTTDIRIYPIGGPSPGAVKYTMIKDDGTQVIFWTKANKDIEQVLVPQHTVFNKAINMDFEEFNYPGTSTMPILNDDGNPTGKTLVLTPESKVKIKPIIIDTGTTQQDRFIEGNEYPFYGIDFNLEITDKEGNVYEIPMQSFIEGGIKQLNEMTLSEKKRKEINDYMFKNRQEGVDLQQSIMNIRGTVNNQFTELYGAPNEVTGLYVSPENVRSIPGFEGLNDYQVSIAGGLLNLISMGEGDYNRKVGQKVSDDVLIDKTLAEIQQMQQEWKNTDVGKKMRSAAFGRYQFMDYTLFGKDGKPGLVQEYNIPMDEVFSPALQDYLALLLLKRRGFDKYISGQISEDNFIDRLSQEWTSVEHKSGRSFYEGDGVNKAHISRDKVSQVLNQ